MDTLLDAALDAAGHGFAVFPLRPRSKIPFSGSHGFKDATNDHDQIRAWWTRTPEANIGIVTGALSGIFVVDVDGRNGGRESWDVLRATYGRTPETVTVLTRPDGSGFHLYFRLPEGGAPCGQLAPGIDIKGDGGYVLGAGSIHPDTGQPYVYAVGREP